MKLTKFSSKKFIALILISAILIAFFTAAISIFLNAKKQSAAAPNILFNAMTKSGSEYIAKTLIDNLNYDRRDFYSTYSYKDNQIKDSLRSFFKAKGILAKQHLSASPFTLQDGHQFPLVLDINRYKGFSDRILIHVRDPRQAVLSRTHHTNFYKRGGPFSQDLPADYFNFTFKEQLDWNIEHYLPTLVAWLQSWLDLQKQESMQPNGLKVLFTTYNELLKDERQLYKKIITFYGLDANKFNFQPTEKTAKVNYRKGDPNEWKTQMTSEQKQRMAELIPQHILDEFNW